MVTAAGKPRRFMAARADHPTQNRRGKASRTDEAARRGGSRVGELEPKRRPAHSGVVGGCGGRRTGVPGGRETRRSGCNERESRSPVNWPQWRPKIFISSLQSVPNDHCAFRHTVRESQRLTVAPAVRTAAVPKSLPPWLNRITPSMRLYGVLPRDRASASAALVIGAPLITCSY